MPLHFTVVLFTSQGQYFVSDVFLAQLEGDESEETDDASKVLLVFPLDWKNDLIATGVVTP